MYLNKKTYVQNWEHTPPNELHKITVLKGGKLRTDINPERISYIEEQICYWRKANQIHNWFIENCADGDGNKREMDVSREQLEDLVKTCKNALMIISELPKKKIEIVAGWNKDGDIKEEIEVYDKTELLEEILPTQNGFFFGSTEYDDWYKQSLENTIKMLEEELVTESSDYYVYEASW